ncbi:MAG TPA: response regulator [Opitutus sp.]|nr:response regulator [Opitutus sp.]
MKKTHPTLLLIDDDPNDLFLLETAFEAAGLEAKIQPAVGGRAAIDYLSANGQYADRASYKLPDFVITDLKMPDVDGFEVLRFLKSVPELAFIPAVVFSGSADNDDIKRAYALGASSYHVKPSDPSMLFTLVRALHAYWVLCELPERNETRIQSGTASGFKLGERFSDRPHLRDV